MAWGQVVGTAAVIDDPGRQDAVDALAARYSQYRNRPPSGPLLRLAPERIVCWRASG